MQTRRDFLKTATLGSQALIAGNFPEAIARAVSIDPNEDTTFLDAEHVVILMQENRSFDHAYGSLNGVRGFKDPRPHILPDNNEAWFQPDKDGTVIPPFRLSMEGSNVTWIGGTPHSWRDQVDARNGGKYDKWLTAKARGDKFPMTMGFFTREDIPFYYDFADAFTIFDYAFCSSLTGTTPNRLYLWSGTIREDAKSTARVQNGDTDYDVEAAWTTYPERLQKAGVSWKIYQNEISLDTGFVGEEDAWLSNFTDNPIEWFSQYRVRFSKSRRNYLPTLIQKFEARLSETQTKLAANPQDADKTKLEQQLKQITAQLEQTRKEATEYTEETWAKLSPAEKALHEGAFCSNRSDADFRSLINHPYDDNGTQRNVAVPKGDVLYQFRADAESGKLPAVSWLVAPEKFSDHPGSAWFGAWYISEILDILTKDPELWKKTIFIICYDENDGFFDHVPPFVAPHPNRPETGKVSADIDTTEDVSNAYGRNHSIGLGYRCPLLIASPWSRGGCVNSQVTDHTSILMFLETWLQGKGNPVRETNISQWRRTVCGDLTSSFRPWNGETYPLPKRLDRDAYIERIHKASFQKPPVPADKLQVSDIPKFSVGAFQEKGTRPSCPLPYELDVDIALGENGVNIRLAAGNNKFKKNAAGGAFNAYSYNPEMIARAYAVTPGDAIEDTLPTGDKTHVRVDGPNGFLRELRSDKVALFNAKLRQDGADVVVTLTNTSNGPLEITLTDKSYNQKLPVVKLSVGQTKTQRVSTKTSAQWYDIAAASKETIYRFAGRTETGKWTTSDPAMA